MTLNKQISLFTEDQLMFLPEDSLVNHFQTQEHSLGNTMSDIYLRKCLELYERLSPDGLLVKTFVPLLHQNLAEFSNIYAHQWKVKVTKCNRLLFQLQRLVPSMKDIGFGLLPTPVATDFRDRGTYWDKCNQRRLEIGKQVGLSTLFKKTPCPSCVVHIMGFPENWLSRPFMEQETP